MDADVSYTHADVPVLPPAALAAGLSAQAERPRVPGGRTLRIDDSATGTTRIFSFDRQGFLISVETLSAAGEAKVTETHDPARRTSRFTREGVACVRTASDGNVTLQCEGGLPFVDADEPSADECRRPAISTSVRSAVDALLADLDHLSFGTSGAPYENDDGLQESRLGNNVVAAGCGGYAASNPDLSEPGRHSGPQGLADDLGAALRKGLKCMMDQSTPQSLGNFPHIREAAVRLSAFLVPGYSRPLRVLCHPTDGTSMQSYGSKFTMGKGAIASAQVDCTHPTFPTLAVRLDRSNQQGNRPEAAAFHELLHVAGYPHNTAVDLPYLVAGCCFESANTSSLSCRMSRSTDAFTSSGYLTNFADYMIGERGRPDVAAPTYLAAYRQTPSNPIGVVDGAAQAMSRLRGTAREARETGWPMYYFMIGNLALQDTTDSSGTTTLGRAIGRYYSATSASEPDFPKVKLAQELSTFLAETRGNRMVVPRATIIKRLLTQQCSLMHKNERWALAEFGKNTEDLLNASAKANLASEGINWKAPCG